MAEAEDPVYREALIENSDPEEEKQTPKTEETTTQLPSPTTVAPLPIAINLLPQDSSGPFPRPSPVFDILPSPQVQISLLLRLLNITLSAHSLSLLSTLIRNLFTDQTMDALMGSLSSCNNPIVG